MGLLLAQAAVDPAVSVSFGWKQLMPLLGASGVILPTVIGVGWWLGARYARDQIKSLRTQLENMTGSRDLAEERFRGEETKRKLFEQAADDRGEQLKQRNAELAALQTKYDKVFRAGSDEHHRRKALQAKYDKLVIDHADDKKLIDVLNELIGGKDEKLAELLAEVGHRQKLLDQSEGRMKKAQKLRGYLTQAKALQKVPKFRPLSERGRAVISVLNFKGGVGKTTVTAHLAGALARKGYRVLLLDLDLQGSLSALMVAEAELDDRKKARRMTQDFFQNAADDVLHKLSRYAVVVPGQPGDVLGSIHVIPTTDELAYSELNLNLGWLLRQGERDARFLLRKALHLKTDNSAYDIVLIDCPPLLNISCVNALAASDYLLVPTILSMKSAERVPKLLVEVSQDHFKRHVNSQLKVMGVVANRTNRTPPAGNEANLWQSLPKRIDEAYAGKVKLFDTVIGQDAKITAGEAQFIHPELGTRARVVFDALADEVEQELPRECRVAPPPSAGVG